jgi:hypothetical protein
MMTNNTYARHPTSPEADLTCQQVTALLVDYVAGEMDALTCRRLKRISAIVRRVRPFWPLTRRPSAPRVPCATRPSRRRCSPGCCSSCAASSRDPHKTTLRMRRSHVPSATHLLPLYTLRRVAPEWRWPPGALPLAKARWDLTWHAYVR